MSLKRLQVLQISLPKKDQQPLQAQDGGPKDTPSAAVARNRQVKLAAVLEGETSMRLAAKHAALRKVYFAGKYDDQRTQLLVEYCPKTFLELVEARGASGVQLKKLLEDYTGCLAGLHADGVFHFDVKATNLLVDSEGNGKVGDLGACFDLLQLRWDRNNFSVTDRIDFLERSLEGIPEKDWNAFHVQLQAILKALRDKEAVSSEDYEKLGKIDVWQLGGLLEDLAKIEGIEFLKPLSDKMRNCGFKTRPTMREVLQSLQGLDFTGFVMEKGAHPPLPIELRIPPSPPTPKEVRA